MPRSDKAQIAVDMYGALWNRFQWDKSDAWKGIAHLLLTCQIWDRSWRPFHDVVVYREVNSFRMLNRGPNAALQKAESLSGYLAHLLGLPRQQLCQEIGLYWEDPRTAALQPHNLVGHAYRSLTVDILERFGDPGIRYVEEVDPYDEFPGHDFQGLSEHPKIDIVARRGNKTVALISSRWRYRHDRVGVVDEAHAYIGAARRQYSGCQFIASVGEFDAARLGKVLENCPPESPHGPLAATVHFQPRLVTEGLGTNGRTHSLQDFEWLIDQTFLW